MRSIPDQYDEAQQKAIIEVGDQVEDMLLDTETRAAVEGLWSAYARGSFATLAARIGQNAAKARELWTERGVEAGTYVTRSGRIDRHNASVAKWRTSLMLAAENLHLNDHPMADDVEIMLTHFAPTTDSNRSSWAWVAQVFGWFDKHKLSAEDFDVTDAFFDTGRIFVKLYAQDTEQQTLAGLARSVGTAQLHEVLAATYRDLLRLEVVAQRYEQDTGRPFPGISFAPLRAAFRRSAPVADAPLPLDPST